mmetsp:Transcript_6304/g.9168  ORF Transcript_6304/g.9168 Transcript_6304/m.9168 type:complete len:396 (+) Transcript_6304:3105-4292(+)
MISENIEGDILFEEIEQLLQKPVSEHDLWRSQIRDLCEPYFSYLHSNYDEPFLHPYQAHLEPNEKKKYNLIPGIDYQYFVFRDVETITNVFQEWNAIYLNAFSGYLEKMSPTYYHTLVKVTKTKYDQKHYPNHQFLPAFQKMAIQVYYDQKDATFATKKSSLLRHPRTKELLKSSKPHHIPTQSISIALPFYQLFPEMNPDNDSLCNLDDGIIKLYKRMMKKDSLDDMYHILRLLDHRLYDKAHAFPIACELYIRRKMYLVFFFGTLIETFRVVELKESNVMFFGPYKCLNCERICGVFVTDSHYKCSDCNATVYCSSACRKLHRPIHAVQCYRTKIEKQLLSRKSKKKNKRPQKEDQEMVEYKKKATLHYVLFAGFLVVAMFFSYFFYKAIFED